MSSSKRQQSPKRYWNDRLLSGFQRLSRALDRVIPKDESLWVFALARADQWGSNQHALYEYVRREQPQVRPRIVRLLTLLPHSLGDLVERWALLRAGVIIIHHGPADFRHLCHPTPAFRRVIFNVWHGINTKGIGLQAAKDERGRAAVHAAARYYTAVAASSEANRSSLCSGLALSSDRVLVTGRPRNDWLTCLEHELPAQLLQQEAQLAAELEGRKLVLYAPTFRDASQAGFFPFSAEQAKQIAALLNRQSAVMGWRPHINAKDFTCPDWALDVSPHRYPETQLLLRRTSLLITDYSGIWIDLLLRECPMLLFCYDHEHYGTDRGLIYDLDAIFPGPTARTFEDFYTQLARLLCAESPLDSERRRAAVQLFHTFTDSHSSARVFGEIRRLQRVSTRWPSAAPAKREPASCVEAPSEPMP